MPRVNGSFVGVVPPSQSGHPRGHTPPSFLGSVSGVGSVPPSAVSSLVGSSCFLSSPFFSSDFSVSPCSLLSETHLPSEEQVCPLGQALSAEHSAGGGNRHTSSM